MDTKSFEDSNFELVGSSSSGLAISYTSSNTVVATVSGSTVSIVGAGTSEITASQAGNDNYNAATDVTQTLTVSKASQNISFETLQERAFGDDDFELSASATSGLAISYTSSNTAVATVSGSTVTIVGAGTSEITASQVGDDNYNAATDVTQTLIVTKGSQTISFAALEEKAFDDTDFELSASATSGLAISYTSSNTEVATVSGSTVTIVGAGTTEITASQEGDDNYNAATSVTQTLTVTEEVITNVNDEPISTFSIYPNPASDQLNIDFANSISANVEIVDLLGRTVAEYKVQGNSLKIPVMDFEEGIYILHIKTSAGEEINKKIYIQH